MENKVFYYNGANITFQLGNGDVMVNATQMAKSFGKQPSDWMKNKSAKEFIHSLSVVRNILRTDLVIVSQGGNIQGTWMHEDVALEFARWLNPQFAIWCNDRIKELLKHGATAINPDDLLNPDFIIRIATELKQERAARQLAEETIKYQSNELRISAPKVDYHDRVLNAQGVISTTEIAKELGYTSAKALNKVLRQLGVIWFVNNTWTLKAPYSGKNYIKYKTYTYTNHLDQECVSRSLYWTEKGRKFVHDFLASKQVG
ncbi:MAG: phage antirepressor KilAC domain-containing protein [Carboxylicivirga sp.]|jgi:phage antirepressor YoqD-like protein|nr:phage antirepressor KilAC domain-containing protein [Carboxylicivirga sp.]